MSDVNDYVAGDVNTIDDGYDDEDVNEDVNEGSDSVDNAATATAVLQFIATSLAEDASAVSVEVSRAPGQGRPLAERRGRTTWAGSSDAVVARPRPFAPSSAPRAHATA